MMHARKRGAQCLKSAVSAGVSEFWHVHDSIDIGSE